MADRPPPRSPLLFRRWTFRGARPFHGGRTTEAATGKSVEPESGYAVGQSERTAAQSRPGLFGRRVAHEKAAQARLARRFPPDNGYYVGSWRESGGKVDYDPARIFTSREDAMESGRVNKQKAIYDFKNKREIPVT